MLNGLLFNWAYTQTWKSFSLTSELKAKYEQDSSANNAYQLAIESAYSGNYQEALWFYDKYYRNKAVTDKADSFLLTLNQLPATTELMNRVKDQQFIVVDHVPYLPTQKYFITTLLPELKKQGYHFLGIDDVAMTADTLPSNDVFEADEHSPTEFKEYYYRQLIRSALDLGFVVFSLNDFYKSERDSVGDSTANNVLPFWEKYPNEKAILLTDSYHLQRTNRYDNQPTITSELMNNGCYPFVLKLTSFIERSTLELEPKFLETIKEPVYLASEQAEFKGFDSDNLADMLVVLPKWKNIDIPKEKANFTVPTKRFIEYPAMLMVFNKDEFNKNSEKLIPIKMKEVLSEDSDTSFYLPKGEYTFLFAYTDRGIYHTLNVQITK